MARIEPDETASRLNDLVRTYLREPDGYATDSASGNPVFDFMPPLTSAEQATYADLLLMAKMGVTANITLAEFQAIKPQLAEIRSFRTRTLAQWNALTAAQRQTDTIQYLNDLADVDRALLRS